MQLSAMSEAIGSSADGLSQISVDDAAISERDKDILKQWVDAVHQGEMSRDALIQLLLSRLKHSGSQHRPDGDKTVQEIAAEFEEDFTKRTAEKFREIEEKFKLNEIEDRIKALRAENDHLKADNQSLMDKIEDEKRRVGDANKLLSASDETNRQEIDRLSKENEALKSERDSTASQLKETLDRAKDAESARDGLQQRLDEVEKERDQLQTTCNELKRTNSSLSEMETNKNAETIRLLEAQLKSDAEKFEERLKAAEAQIVESKKDAAASAEAVVSMKEQLHLAKSNEESSKKLADEAQKAAEELAAKLDAADEEIAKLESTAEFYKEAQSTIQKLQAEKVALEKQLEEHKTQSGDQSSQVKSLEGSIQSLKAELETAKQEAQEKQAQIESEAASREQTKRTLEAQLAEAQSNLKKEKEQRESVEQKFQTSAKDLEGSQAQLKTLKEDLKQLSQLQSELQDTKKKLKEVQQENAKLSESSGQIQTLQKQLSEKDSTFASEKKMIESHHADQIAHLKQQLQSSGNNKAVSPLFIQQLGRLQQELRQFKALTEELKQKQAQFKSAEEIINKLEEARTKALKSVEQSRSSRAEMEATINTLQANLLSEKESASQWREQYLAAEDEKQNVIAELRRIPTAQLKVSRSTTRSNVWFFLFFALLIAIASVVLMRWMKKHFQDIIYAW